MGCGVQLLKKIDNDKQLIIQKLYVDNFYLFLTS